ncbi:CBK_G0024100.mRNA.1.CDS.1 [Saccharomyces cerevisiae]|nr:CBK_G0024100.mRNA.1.CDS.1 [Saccharomyces cerevisiae]CAI7334285.1 CBK_G0024100.mRNA.1.CDS.1 [Saccharomyces cerevisiae]
MVPAAENLSPIPASIDTNDIPLIANDLKLLETQAKLINILQGVPFYLPVNLTKIESLLETLTMGVSNTVDLYFHDNEVRKEWKDTLNFINTIVYTNFFLFSITFAIFQRCEVILYDEFYKNLSNEEINVQLLLIHDKILEILKKIEIIQKKQNFARNSDNNNVTDYSQSAKNKNVLLKFPVSELNRIYLKFKEISDFLMEREVVQRSIIIDKDLESDNLGITTANFNDFYDAFYN